MPLGDFYSLKDITMKLQLLLIAFLSTLLFTACQKEEELNCRDNTLAVYEGDDNHNERIVIEIKEGVGEKEVLITIVAGDPNHPNTIPVTLALSGELNENCSVLKIPSQLVGLQTVSGTLILLGEEIEGLVDIGSGVGTQYSSRFTLTKK